MIESTPTVAKWGIELSFLRTTIASEFQVVRRLRNKTDLAGVRFFATYGYFDLTCVKVLDSLLSPSSLTLDADIIESATFRFVSPARDDRNKVFTKALDRWAAAIAIFLKVHPAHVESEPINARWLFARKIAEKLTDAFVFCGFGTCELLVMLGGPNLPELLRLVTDMRDPGKRNPLNSLRPRLKNNAPLFAGTSTFPLVSYKRVHRGRDYKRLRGDIEPAISVSCDPESESIISGGCAEELKALNVYGRHDLVLTWPSAVPMHEFVSTVNKMRNTWAKIGCVAHTTSYLENARERLNREFRLNRRTFSIPSSAVLMKKELRTKTLRNIEPAGLRAAVTDVALRLNACTRDSKIGTHYADMSNTFEYLQQVASNVTERNAPEHLRNKDRFELTRVVDLARRAILQRHAGLETRPELLSYAESPLLCDIRLLVAAATCIPYFIFDNLMPGRRADRTWTGYVLFYGDSPRWLRQDILALPASSIFDPIREWWKITHESAHAIFRILDGEERLGPRFKQVEQYIHKYMRRDVNATRMISEIFANWFDWNYVFQRDTKFYISTIWQSWLNQPAVFSYAPQYLTRSVAILAAEDLNELIDVLQRGRRKTFLLPYLQRKLDKVLKIISSHRAGSDYIAQIDASRKTIVCDLVERLHPLLFWLERCFETDCNLVGLKTRLCPPYSRLSQHSKMIAKGHVVLQKIVSPCQLHLSLLRTKPTLQIELASNAAYIFTLANAVAQRNRSQRIK
jgi:hypothetical protein